MLFGQENDLAVTGLEFGNYLVVGEAGLEPAHPLGHRNLNPARLPIPPLAHESAAEAYPSTLLSIYIGFWPYGLPERPPHR